MSLSTNLAQDWHSKYHFEVIAFVLKLAMNHILGLQLKLPLCELQLLYLWYLMDSLVAHL